MTKLLRLALLAALAQSGEVVVVGPTLNASWIWAADGVRIRRAGPGPYDGFPVEKDPARPGDAVVVVEIPEATAAGVIHAGLAFASDYRAVDCSPFRDAGVLEFWIRGGNGGEDVEVGLYGAGSDGSKQMAILPVSKFSKVTKDWQRVRIPLRDLAAQSPNLDFARLNQVALHSIAGRTILTLRLAGIRIRIPADR